MNQGGGKGGRERERERERERQRETETGTEEETAKEGGTEGIYEANSLSHLSKRMPKENCKKMFKTKHVIFSVAFEFAMILGFTNTGAW